MAFSPDVPGDCIRRQAVCSFTGLVSVKRAGFDAATSSTPALPHCIPFLAGDFCIYRPRWVRGGVGWQGTPLHSASSRSHFSPFFHVGVRYFPVTSGREAAAVVTASLLSLPSLCCLPQASSPAVPDRFLFQILSMIKIRAQLKKPSIAFGNLLETGHSLQIRRAWWFVSCSN